MRGELPWIGASAAQYWAAIVSLDVVRQEGHNTRGDLPGYNMLGGKNECWDDVVRRRNEWWEERLKEWEDNSTSISGIQHDHMASVRRSSNGLVNNLSWHSHFPNCLYSFNSPSSLNILSQTASLIVTFSNISPLCGTTVKFSKINHTFENSTVSCVIGNYEGLRKDPLVIHNKLWVLFEITRGWGRTLSNTQQLMTI